MNIKELEQYFIIETASLYDIEESKSLFYIITEQLEGWGRSFILINGTLEVSRTQVDRYKEILLKLKKGEPLQYIFTETIFFGLKFKVNPAVLIPRPETEELVEWILHTINSDQHKTNSILDVGTGSGCIAISLKKHLAATKVSALDISSEAIAVAKENAKINGLSINFINEDILNYDSGESYDLIVSNPPYIKEDERMMMHQNVLDHEPHLALFVTNEKPLIFYEAIADFALTNLNRDGRLFFEINEYLGGETTAMLKTKGFNTIALKKDMQGKDRMISCRL